MRNNATLLFLCLTLFAALVVFLAAWHVGLILSWSRSPLKLATSGPLDQYETHPALYHFNLVSYPDTNFTQRRQHEASTVADIVEVEPFYKSWNLSVVTLIEPEISRNCTALFKGDTAEVNKVLAENRNWPSTAYDQKFNKLYLESEGCEDIVSEFQGNFYVSEEESSFPLAFSMNVHDNAQQVIRLLKAIYRPHNAYCIHYDSKSDRSFKKVFDKLAKCLPNVIIPKKIINVVYECYPILEAQLSCMTDLLALRDRYPWNYTTTLCGKELPLRTNREIVHLLKQMKGLPALYSHPFDSNELSRKLFRMVIKNNICVHTRIKLDHRVPYGMELIKSMAYFSLTPEFTDYILNSPEAKALGEFLKPTKGPEEAFYGTLLHYWMNGTHKSMKFPPVSGTTWIASNDKNKQTHCRGSIVRRVCILSSGDLQQLQSHVKPDQPRYPFFYNKYNMSADHTIMDCLEEELVRRNRLEYLRDREQQQRGRETEREI